MRYRITVSGHDSSPPERKHVWCMLVLADALADARLRVSSPSNLLELECKVKLAAYRWGGENTVYS